MCTQAQLTSPEFYKWKKIFASALPHRGLCDAAGRPHMHRKLWEWCFIAEALNQHGLLAPGKKGLGFAVGKEPLPAAFAGFGCDILATDLETDTAAQKGWVRTDQHSASLEALNTDGMLDDATFQERVTFQFVDMNAVPKELQKGEFDFVWSSCSMEHLGSLRHGIDFVKHAMNCLKPGGIAVHTTEFNVVSNDATIESGETVLYRRCDLEALASWLAERGHELKLDFTAGSLPGDKHVDVPPYNSLPHFKIQLGKHVTTSYGLIIEKGATAAQEHDGPIGRRFGRFSRLFGSLAAENGA
jgi:hypothetical protein